MDCPFCRHSKEEEDRVLCGNALAYCLLNFEPLKDGHVMVIPRRHVQRLQDLTPEEAHAMNAFTDLMVDLLAKEFGENPAIRINSGGHKSQPHLHTHVLPSKGDLRDHFSAFEGMPRRTRKPPEELAAMARRLRDALK